MQYASAILIFALREEAKYYQGENKVLQSRKQGITLSSAPA